MIFESFSLHDLFSRCEGCDLATGGKEKGMVSPGVGSGGGLQRVSSIINGNLHEGHWDGGGREEEETEEIRRDSRKSKQVAVE